MDPRIKNKIISEYYTHKLVVNDVNALRAHVVSTITEKFNVEITAKYVAKDNYTGNPA